ncbi:hypothetical protein [Falsibacillus pallidus]|uniref:hypothetical protein n=1 Tax=Falsibacillus pallidus TaxID=493781 RepID=UPI003D97F006
METNQVLQAIKELSTQMNERFDRLESRFEKVESRPYKIETSFDNIESKVDQMESRLDRLEEGQQVIKDQLDLLVKEHWENKTDIHKLKKIIRIAQN